MADAVKPKVNLENDITSLEFEPRILAQANVQPAAPALIISDAKADAPVNMKNISLRTIPYAELALEKS